MEELHEVDLQPTDVQRLLPVGQGDLDLLGGGREVLGQLRHLLGDGGAGVEEDEAERHEGHQVADRHHRSSRQRKADLEEAHHRRHHEGEQPR